jgi:hypothetical protein
LVKTAWGGGVDFTARGESADAVLKGQHEAGLYPCRFPNAAIQNPFRVSHQLATNGLMPSVRRRQRTSIAERRHCFATTVPLVCPKVSLRRAYSAGFSGARVHFLGENCEKVILCQSDTFCPPKAAILFV